MLYSIRIWSCIIKRIDATNRHHPLHYYHSNINIHTYTYRRGVRETREEVTSDFDIALTEALCEHSKKIVKAIRSKAHLRSSWRPAHTNKFCRHIIITTWKSFYWISKILSSSTIIIITPAVFLCPLGEPMWTHERVDVILMHSDKS